MNPHSLYLILTAGSIMQEGEAAAGNPMLQMAPIIIMFVIFYFVLIVPQKKEAKERDKMRSELKKGDEVVTAGGIHGQVLGGDKNTVTVKIATKTEVVVDRSAIARLERAGEGSGASVPDDPGKAGEAKK